MGNYLDIVLVIWDLTEIRTLNFEFQQCENKAYEPPFYHQPSPHEFCGRCSGLKGGKGDGDERDQGAGCGRGILSR